MHAAIIRSLRYSLSFTTAVAVVAFAAPVIAGDVPLAPRSWTGFYAGVHGGWGWGKTKVEDPLFSPPFNPTEYTYNGPLAGAQLGANWQLGNLCAGG